MANVKKTLFIVLDPLLIPSGPLSIYDFPLNFAIMANWKKWCPKSNTQILEEEAYSPFLICCPMRRPRHLLGLGLQTHLEFGRCKVAEIPLSSERPCFEDKIHHNHMQTRSSTSFCIKLKFLKAHHCILCVLLWVYPVLFSFKKKTKKPCHSGSST